MTRAAVYCRISFDPEGRALGVERQEQDARALAERRGWDVSERVYVDNDVSASGSKRRPAWERLLADIEAGDVDALVSYSSSRLYRNLRDLGRLLDLAESRALPIATVASGDVDVSTADGRMIARILASVDAAEAERVGERTKRSHRARAERGEVHGSLGFGYDKNCAVVPDEAEAIRDASERILNGESLGSIVRAWTAAGFRSRRGGEFNHQTLRRVLTAPRIAGLRDHRGELFPATWAPIVDRRTWERVSELLADPSRTSAPFRGRYLLSGGLLRCGLCGHQLAGQPARGVPGYVCLKSKGGCGRLRVNAAELERFVDLAAMRHHQTAERTVGEPNAELLELETEAAELERRLAEANRLRIAEGWSPAEYAATATPWRERLAEVEAAIEAVQHREPDTPFYGLTSGQLNAMLTPEAWAAGLEAPERRSALRAELERKVDHVEVAPAGRAGRWAKVADRVNIVWRPGVVEVAP
jgi:DNA invertase Pin-like site-specific DNA recombinase